MIDLGSGGQETKVHLARSISLATSSSGTLYEKNGGKEGEEKARGILFRARECCSPLEKEKASRH